MDLQNGKHNMTYVNLVLDIGAGEGSFLSFLSPHIRSGIGIDPILTTSIECETYTLIPGTFPHDFSTCDRFYVITLLAVVEHIPEAELSKVADTCWHYLKTGGRVIITVSHPFVDKILDVLKFSESLTDFHLRNTMGLTLKSCQIFSTDGNSLKKNVGSLDVITYSYLKHVSNFERNKDCFLFNLFTSLLSFWHL